ncbi:hypothetical protein ACH5RR_022588 [Cinchona calisaya]|uniref:F-box domain-containing protein n=1 Tax=Cinchona calisaya TaxID=153742 RepID=A0ABD2Z879_9GENT
MGLQCFRWIHHLLLNYGLITSLFPPYYSRDIQQLPDDVIVEILRRLPADGIIRCLHVCRRWRSLVLSEYFRNLVLNERKSATKSILVLDTKYLRAQGSIKYILDGGKREEELTFLCIDDQPISSRRGIKTSKIRVWPGLEIARHYDRFIGSCDGLLLFSDVRVQCRYFVFNPVTQEEISIAIPPVVSVSETILCGFFFHSLTCQFKLLFLQPISITSCEYFIYTIGDGSCRKIATSTHNLWPSSYYAPSPPAVINGALHWIARSTCEFANDLPPSYCCRYAILVFRMDAEDLLLFPHPGEECKTRGTHSWMQLVVKDGKYVSLFSFDCSDNIVDIWTLKDYSNWDWVLELKLNLDLVDSLPTLERFIRGRPEVLKFENGQVWFDCWMRGLFVYNVDQDRLITLGIPSLFSRKANHTSFALTKSL